MRPIVRKWRSEGIRCVLYLDDGIVIGQSRDEAELYSVKVQHDLRDAGLVVNQKKSVWEPSRNCQWLGMQIDLQAATFVVPTEKLTQLKLLLKTVADNFITTPRILARVAGKVMSMSVALGPVTIG